MSKQSTNFDGAIAYFIRAQKCVTVTLWGPECQTIVAASPLLASTIRCIVLFFCSRRRSRYILCFCNVYKKVTNHKFFFLLFSSVLKLNTLEMNYMLKNPNIFLSSNLFSFVSHIVSSLGENYIQLFVVNYCLAASIKHSRLCRRWCDGVKWKCHKTQIYKFVILHDAVKYCFKDKQCACVEGLQVGCWPNSHHWCPICLPKCAPWSPWCSLFC